MKQLIILSISIVALQLGAQTITNYTTAEGLLDNFVECIDVDVNDNIWLGTSIGVQMFDGSSLAVYNVATYPGMLSDNIKCITAISNGEVWIGTDYGANQLISGVSGFMWLPHTTANGLNSNKVYCIEEDGNGGIWIGTDVGVSYYNGSSWISYGSPDLHWSGVSAIAFDSNGDKWFGSPLGHIAPVGGLTHFDGITFTTYDNLSGMISDKPTSIIVDDQDNKWIGTDIGMSVLNSSNTSFIDHIEMYSLPPPHDSINPVVDIGMDSYSRIWAAIYVGYLAEGGIAYWNGSQWQDFHVSDGLVGPNVKGLAIDSEDNVWVATTNGVSKISFVPSFLSNISNSIVDVYPNPTLGKVYINPSSIICNNISVYTSLGSIVYFEDIKSTEEIEIDLSFLSEGLYHISIHSDKGVENHKILIN